MPFLPEDPDAMRVGRWLQSQDDLTVHEDYCPSSRYGLTVSVIEPAGP